ncbi:MAG: DUF3127 domain-containing protein [Bacteroidota bacterium]
MDIPAKHIKTLPIQSGLSINGSWSKQNIIVETTDDYPKKVCISIWNGKVDITKLDIGREYVFCCNIESKEFKGKWYTEVTVWKIEETQPEIVKGATQGLRSFPELGNFVGNTMDIDDLMTGSPIDETQPELRKNTTFRPGILDKLRKNNFKGLLGSSEELGASADDTLAITGNEPKVSDFMLASDNVPDDNFIPSVKITSDDISGESGNSHEDNTLSLNPFHGKLKIDPEKLKNLHFCRKIKKDDSDDPDSSL